VEQGEEIVAKILDEEGDGVGSGAGAAALVAGKRMHEPAIPIPIDGRHRETVQNPLSSPKAPPFANKQTMN